MRMVFKDIQTFKSKKIEMLMIHNMTMVYIINISTVTVMMITRETNKMMHIMIQILNMKSQITATKTNRSQVMMT